MNNAFDVIVIGAGTNGLAAAAVLGKAGRRVLVLERADAIGGQARVIEFAPGFRAAPFGEDAGWLPPEIENGLGLAVERVHPDVPFTVAVEPGAFLSLPRDPVRSAVAIGRFSERDASAWPAFTRHITALSGFLAELYRRPATDIHGASARDAVPLLALARRFRRMGRHSMTEFMRTVPMPVRDLADDWFETEPLKAAIAAGGILNIRQGPRAGGTAFVLLHHLVGALEGTVRGRGYWRSGPDSLIAALEAVARNHGAEIRTGTPVLRIDIRNGAARGVTLEDGQELRADHVVSTADPARTLLGMVEPAWLDPEFLEAVSHIKYRGSTAVVLFAVQHSPGAPALDQATSMLGVLSLSPTIDGLERAADAAKYGTVSEKPHIEFTVPTCRWPGLAPDGQHVLAARVQFAPYRLDGDRTWTDTRRDALGDTVMAAIDSVMPSFSSAVLHRSVLAPPDIERELGLTEGAVTHGEITLDQILFMRPVPGSAHHAMPIPGLYMGGAGTHPGPGIAGGPGWFAARRILHDGRRKGAARPNTG